MRILAVITSSIMRMRMSESIFQLPNAYKRRRSEDPPNAFVVSYRLYIFILYIINTLLT